MNVKEKNRKIRVEQSQRATTIFSFRTRKIPNKKKKKPKHKCITNGTGYLWNGDEIKKKKNILICFPQVRNPNVNEHIVPWH